MIKLQSESIDIASVENSVYSQQCGAVIVFVGRTRDYFEEKRVISLEYEAYEAMALKEMGKIIDFLKQQYPKLNGAIVHRMGRVPVGEASVVIAISTPHRRECYEASRYAIDSLKTNVPIWKKEIYEKGEEWKANQ